MSDAFARRRCWQEWLSWLLAPLLSTTRPMDQMALSWSTPQEDELATCQLTGGLSPYMPLMFMRDEAQFRPLFALDQQAPAAAVAEWERCFLLFLRKVDPRDGVGVRHLKPGVGSYRPEFNPAFKHRS